MFEKAKIGRLSGNARDFVDKLIAAADMPRAIVGRTKNGGGVMLFRYDGQNVVPSIQGESSIDGVFKLAIKDGEIKITLTCASEGQTLDLSTY